MKRNPLFILLFSSLLSSTVAHADDGHFYCCKNVAGECENPPVHTCEIAKESSAGGTKCPLPDESCMGQCVNPGGTNHGTLCFDQTGGQCDGGTCEEYVFEDPNGNTEHHHHAIVHNQDEFKTALLTWNGGDSDWEYDTIEIKKPSGQFPNGDWWEKNAETELIDIDRNIIIYSDVTDMGCYRASPICDRTNAWGLFTTSPFNVIEGGSLVIEGGISLSSVYGRHYLKTVGEEVGTFAELETALNNNNIPVITIDSNITFTSQLTVNRDVTIYGGGNTFKPKWGNKHRFFDVSTYQGPYTFRVHDLTFEDGYEPVYNGGAIRASDGIIIATNCIFKNNYAGGGGGAIGGGGKKNPWDYVPGSFTNCAFTNNTANTNGGGAVSAYDQQWLTFTGCTFKNNTVNNGEGGAVMVTRGNFANCEFTYNNVNDGSWANGVGGGVDVLTANVGDNAHRSSFDRCEFNGKNVNKIRTSSVSTMHDLATQGEDAFEAAGCTFWSGSQCTLTTSEPTASPTASPSAPSWAPTRAPTRATGHEDPTCSQIKKVYNDKCACDPNGNPPPSTIVNLCGDGTDWHNETCKITPTAAPTASPTAATISPTKAPTVSPTAAPTWAPSWALTGTAGEISDWSGWIVSHCSGYCKTNTTETERIATWIVETWINQHGPTDSNDGTTMNSANVITSFSDTDYVNAENAGSDADMCACLGYPDSSSEQYTLSTSGVCRDMMNGDKGWGGHFVYGYHTKGAQHIGLVATCCGINETC
jgi:hypothetical protein